MSRRGPESPPFHSDPPPTFFSSSPPQKVALRFLAERGRYDPWLDLPHLRVFVAQPQYLLASALAIGEPYYDEPMVKRRTRLALEAMFSVSGP